MSDPGLIIAQSIVGDADARHVVLELPCSYDENKPYARELARDIGMPMERLHRILKRLTAGGYVTYGPAGQWFEKPAGSSYWLTEQGEILRRKLAAGEL